MSIRDYEREQEIKKKKSEGWYFNNEGILVPPRTRKSKLISKTSDPDYYSETLLHEFRACRNEVVDCFNEIKKQLTFIKENMMKKKRRVEIS